ncbi:hypothetical protein [Pseudomonas viridiflava]|uniref:hypothetical protein n=1 Tax=Pseudomonas viridiflava TaxID=33069 RepID=UPI000F0112C7|nr:hypothetical protein [Pseudomonas viridiflava]
MRKQVGHAGMPPVIDLVQCPRCRGRSVIKGIFHEMPCDGCNASGFVRAVTLDALPVETLVTQLSLRLRRAEHQLALVSPVVQPPGAAAQYEQNNRRGAGGSNYTGD